MNSQYTSYLFIIWKVVDNSLGVRQFAIHYQMQVKTLKRYDLCSGFYELLLRCCLPFQEWSNQCAAASFFFFVHCTSSDPEWVNGKNIWEWLPSFSLTSSGNWGQDTLALNELISKIRHLNELTIQFLSHSNKECLFLYYIFITQIRTFSVEFFKLQKTNLRRDGYP